MFVPEPNPSSSAATSQLSFISSRAKSNSCRERFIVAGEAQMAEKAVSARQYGITYAPWKNKHYRNAHKAELEHRTLRGFTYPYHLEITEWYKEVMRGNRPHWMPRKPPSAAPPATTKSDDSLTTVSEWPTPKQGSPASEQQSAASEQGSPASEQGSPAPEQQSPAPEQKSPSPEQKSPSQERESP
ncbi:hypothetical protein GGI42DRAFT_360047 [Trichoderma sp. SZMC 28013]